MNLRQPNRVTFVDGSRFAADTPRRPVVSLLVLLLCVWSPWAVYAQEKPAAKEEEKKAVEKPREKPMSKYKEFSEVTKDAEKLEGLFTLYRKDEHLYAEIESKQFDQPLLAPIAIARGMASAGTPLNFGDEWILLFRKAGDKIQLVRRNVHYEAPKDTPLEKAVRQNFTDSVLVALPIISKGPRGGLLVDLADIFLTDFADLKLGKLDRNRTTWRKIKAFPNNVELQVEATFSRGGRPLLRFFGDDGVIDSRGITVVLHYSLAKLPESGYKPRFADQRVGHFISATKDFGSQNPDTIFARRINRWRLEKADPKAKLSAPKTQLIWWVEDTVPHQYRPYVEEGILEWNKAYERIGFRNAIGVRWQNERDEFDPEDINYCTFRWITTPHTFAMSGLRANPITGEMIDGDVIFDAGWIRYWKEEYAFLVGAPMPSGEDSAIAPIDVGEIVSPIMAAKNGYGLPFPLVRPRLRMPTRRPLQDAQRPQLAPSTWSPLHTVLSRRFGPGKLTACQYAVTKRHEFTLAAIALAAKEEGKAELKLPEKFIGQAIKEVVMHEVGHSLGLRHNFRGSAMLPLDQINDTSITREKGMVGSVMDYNPINIAPKDEKQGDYATTTIGPYDYWAIEYAYKPIEENEADELKKIAARSPEPDLAYATDEDLSRSSDPLVNTYDLGSDPLKYGQQRMALAADLLKDLDEKVVKEGESWARLRRAFTVLLWQYGDAAYLASSHIGGQHFSRDFRGGEKSRDPIVPVPGAKQREALDYVAQEILGDKAFRFSPQLLRRLTMEHWYHWGSDSFFFLEGVNYPIYDRILAIQRIVLSHCFDASMLSRIQNHQLLSDRNDKPIQIAEVFQTLTNSVWTELATTPRDKATDLNISTIRRNLQREHLRKLSSIVLGPRRSPYYDLYSYVSFYGDSSSYPADARSLARLHLKDIQKRITANFELSNLKIDDATKAHLDECQELIQKVLDARLEASGP